MKQAKYAEGMIDASVRRHAAELDSGLARTTLPTEDEYCRMLKA